MVFPVGHHDDESPGGRGRVEIVLGIFQSGAEVGALGRDLVRVGAGEGHFCRRIVRGDRQSGVGASCIGDDPNAVASEPIDGF